MATQILGQEDALVIVVAEREDLDMTEAAQRYDADVVITAFDDAAGDPTFSDAVHALVPQQTRLGALSPEGLVEVIRSVRADGLC